jgi:hypothetical protein
MNKCAAELLTSYSGAKSALIIYLAEGTDKVKSSGLAESVTLIS